MANKLAFKESIIQHLTRQNLLVSASKVLYFDDLLSSMNHIPNLFF